jgi:hypothetical protein
MIRSCHDRAVQQLLDRKCSRRLENIERAARVRLALLDVATSASGSERYGSSEATLDRWIAGDKPTLGRVDPEFFRPNPTIDRQLAVTFLCAPGIPDQMRIQPVGALTVSLFMDRVLGMRSEGGEK